MTVAAWLDDWTQKALPASDRKQSTRDLYATVARVHLAPVVGHLLLDRLRPSDVEALVVRKREQRLSGSTVRTIYTGRGEAEGWQRLDRRGVGVHDGGGDSARAAQRPAPIPDNHGPPRA